MARFLRRVGTVRGHFQSSNCGDSRTCHFFGRSDHLINFYRLQLADESSDRIRKRNQKQQNQYQNNQQQQQNSSSRWWNKQLNSISIDQSQQSFDSNMVNATPRSDVVPLGSSDQIDFLSRQAHWIVFKSNIAKFNDNKSNLSYIDSGATHNFIHKRSFFKTFKEITPQNVKIADGFSKIIGKGTININLGITITMEAYFGRDVSNNILTPHIISEFFEVHMTSSICDHKSCLLFRKGSHSIDDIVLKTKWINGIYQVDKSCLNKVALTSST